jgi:hypothetical protein
MNENAKTISLIIVAAAVALIAWVSRPGQWTGTVNKTVGERLTSDFDPLDAASLNITEYDESTATLHPFEVALVDVKGTPRWSIPSHSDYPADAEKQVANAATALMGLQILSVEGDTPADHEKFGVVDPDAKTLKAGAAGVGMRVTIRDKSNKDLLSLIIGKEVPGRPGLRYVRRAGQDAIYTAAINTANLSTQFDRWIEKNLLKFSAWDLQDIQIRDYSIDVLQGALVQKGEMTLDYSDQADPKWKLAVDRRFTEEGKWAPVKLKDDEELNVAKLDGMKTALDDLKIVDVAPKPQGLSADLKASADFMKKEESLLTLQARGFFPAKLDQQIELFSKEGEVRAQMKDGVEYILRFGEITTRGETAQKDDEKSGDQKEGQNQEAKKSATGQNRYLFVMAQFNADVIPKPKFDPMPEAKPEAESKEGKPAAETKPAVKPEDKVVDAKAAAKADEKGEAPAQPANPAEKAAESKDGAPGDKSDAAETDQKPAEQAADKPSIEAQRQQVEKENKRKQEEYDAKVAAGKKHADELNARFADWYYVISDDVYRKIRLGHDDIIKKKDKKDAKAGKPGDAELSPANPAIDFNNLQKQGPGGE